MGQHISISSINWSLISGMASLSSSGSGLYICSLGMTQLENVTISSIVPCPSSAPSTSSSGSLVSSKVIVLPSVTRSEWEEIPFHFLRCFVAISRAGAALMYVPGTMILVICTDCNIILLGDTFTWRRQANVRWIDDDHQATRSRARVGTAHRKMPGNSLSLMCDPEEGIVVSKRIATEATKTGTLSCNPS